MSSKSATPITSLAPAPVTTHVTYDRAVWGRFWGWLILWFVVGFGIAILILWLTKPPIVQVNNAQGQPTGVVDVAKVIWGSVIVGIITAIIFAFVATHRARYA